MVTEGEIELVLASGQYSEIVMEYYYMFDVLSDHNKVMSEGGVRMNECLSECNQQEIFITFLDNGMN